MTCWCLFLVTQSSHNRLRLHYFSFQPIQHRLRLPSNCLSVFVLAPARTQPLWSSLLQWDLGNVFFSFFFFSKGTDTDYLLVWQLQLAATMDGIIRQIPTVERKISLTPPTPPPPRWHSTKSLQSYMRNTILRTNLSKKVQEGELL